MGDETFHLKQGILSPRGLQVANSNMARMRPIVSTLEQFMDKQTIQDPTEIHGYNGASNRIGIINLYLLIKFFIQSSGFDSKFQSNDRLVEAVNLYIDQINVKTQRKIRRIQGPKELFLPDSVLFQPFVSSTIKTRCVANESAVVMLAERSLARTLGETGITTGAAAEAQHPYSDQFGKPEKMGAMYQPEGGNSPGAPCEFRIKNENNRQEMIGDVMQGVCLDCWFMAALYSWFWIKKVPPYFISVNGIFTIPFNKYDYGTKKWTISGIKVKPTLPVFASGNQFKPVFGQLTPDKFELWPALYEKAYSEFIGLKTFDPKIDGADSGGVAPPYIQPYDPDTGAIRAGDPLLALTHISGYLSSEGYNNDSKFPTVYYSKDFNNNADPPGKTAYTILKNLNNSEGLTLFPTVAWSKPAADWDTTWVTNTLVAANHSYSVLGRYNDAGGIPFVILRNPWGLSFDLTDASFNSIRADLAKGFWTPDTTFGNAPVNLEKNSYGIFGIADAMFPKYFAGLGWVRFKLVS